VQARSAEHALLIVAASSAVASGEPRAIGKAARLRAPGHRPPRSTPTNGTWATSVLPDISGVWSGGDGPNSGSSSRPQRYQLHCNQQQDYSFNQPAAPALPDRKVPASKCFSPQPDYCTCNLGQRLYPERNSQLESDKTLIVLISFASGRSLGRIESGIATSRPSRGGLGIKDALDCLLKGSCKSGI
jgi:hypothetical protein